MEATQSLEAFCDASGKNGRTLDCRCMLWDMKQRWNSMAVSSNVQRYGLLPPLCMRPPDSPEHASPRCSASSAGCICGKLKGKNGHTLASHCTHTGTSHVNSMSGVSIILSQHAYPGIRECDSTRYTHLSSRQRMCRYSGYGHAVLHMCKCLLRDVEIHQGV